MFTFRALALAGALLADAALESAQARGASVSVVVSLYIFGFLILWATVALCVGLGLLMLRAGKNLSDPPYFRAFTVILVCGMGTFLVVAGYSAAQMSGMFSLLGAIIGYILGQQGGD